MQKSPNPLLALRADGGGYPFIPMFKESYT